MADSMKESVGALLKGIDRYNPQNLATLEHYVQMQAYENTYNLDANLAVLKLYQFNPSMFKETFACQILLKALMNLPGADFTMCRCLISEHHQNLDVIACVINLADCLETCRFGEFWANLQEQQQLIEGIKEFSNSIRKFICSILSVTYQTIDRALLVQFLGGITGSDLESWAKEHNWEINQDDTVRLSNQEDTIKSRKISEKITFESVSNIIRSAT